MGYRVELDFDLPRARVLALFLDPAALAEWQPDLASFQPLGEGDPRAVGARNRQTHRMGRREVEMIETITEHDDPERFSATYEAHKVWNLIENRFVEPGPDKTRWILDCALKCGGMVRVMAVLFPGMFRRQTLKFMRMFKEFAESVG